MLQLRDTSPFATTLFSAPDLRGVDTLIVVITASFELAAQVELAARQQPVALADEYWGEAATTSLRVPGQAHLPKPGTDVIVIGDACAPGGRPVTELGVELCVGDRHKRVHVWGDRAWVEAGRHVQPSRPRPFERVPIVWERAYGGIGRAAAEPRNPVGAGFLGDRQPEELVGQLVPNVDDPAEPLTYAGQTPRPAGFAAIAPSWQPRVAHAGTYDARWQQQRAPYLPEDFDPRFFVCASPGLNFEHGLRGGEPVALAGFDPERALWQFALPRCHFDLRARVAGTGHPMQPLLDTVIIEPSAARLSMTWRASLAVDERLLAVERVDIGLATLEGAVEPTGSGGLA
jgi:hypothetical protein